MAKEYDIYLRRPLTLGDIVVYSIPFRDGITAISRLILDAQVRGVSMAQFVQAASAVELDSALPEVLKRAFESPENAVCIYSSAETWKSAVLYPVDASILLAQELELPSLTVRTEADSAIRLSQALLGTEATVKFPQISPSVILSAVVDGTKKRDLLSVPSSALITSEIAATQKTSYTEAASEFSLDQSVRSLSYTASSGGESIILLGASVLDADVFNSFGRSHMWFFLGGALSGDGEPTLSTKYEAVEVAAELSCEAGIARLLPAGQAECGIAFSASAEFTARRVRRLADMDPGRLSDYDGMTLDDAYYLTI